MIAEQLIGSRPRISSDRAAESLRGLSRAPINWNADASRARAPTADSVRCGRKVPTAIEKTPPRGYCLGWTDFHTVVFPHVVSLPSFRILPVRLLFSATNCTHSEKESRLSIFTSSSRNRIKQENIDISKD